MQLNVIWPIKKNVHFKEVDGVHFISVRCFKENLYKDILPPSLL